MTYVCHYCNLFRITQSVVTTCLPLSQPVYLIITCLPQSQPVYHCHCNLFAIVTATCLPLLQPVYCIIACVYHCHKLFTVFSQLDDVKETLVERLLGLKEMLPDRVWNVADTGLWFSVWLVRRSLWVVGTSLALLVLPPFIEQQRIEYEEMQKMQKKQVREDEERGVKTDKGREREMERKEGGEEEEEEEEAGINGKKGHFSGREGEKEEHLEESR